MRPPSHDEQPRPSAPSAPLLARAWHADRPLDSYPDATREHTSRTGSGQRSHARSWAPPAGLMRQAPDHRVTSHALAPTAPTPPILTSNTARQHCMVWPHALTRHLQPQAIQARERAQIRAIKGSTGHVEVFQMDGVAISIIGRPRPLPGHDTPNTAHNTYTLNYEEPDYDSQSNDESLAKA